MRLFLIDGRLYYVNVLILFQLFASVVGSENKPEMSSNSYDFDYEPVRSNSQEYRQVG